MGKDLSSVDPARARSRWQLGAAAVLVLNGANLVWIAPRLLAPLGPILFAVEAAFFVSLLLAVGLHWRRRPAATPRPAREAPAPAVDVFVTSCNEPLEIVLRTLEGALAIRYSEKRLHLLDDGGSAELEQFCLANGIGYLARGENRDAKAGNLNHGLAHTRAPYVVTLDADQVPVPEILEVLVDAIEADAKIGAVSSRQAFSNPKGDFNHERFFYDVVQPARDADGCAVAVGSAIIYRRGALDAIGGFVVWNVVEDLTTGYHLNCAGYEVRYVERPLSIGLAPTDLANIYKQRGTWAIDTLRLVFRKPILDEAGLTLRQKLHYLQLGLSYGVFAFLTPLLLALPVVSLVMCWGLIDDTFSSLIHLPGVVGTLALFAYVGGSWDAPRMACGLWPVYLRAFLLALRPEKIRYRVTDKVEAYGGRHLGLILPQLGLLAATAGAWLVHHARHGVDNIGLSMAAVAAFNTWWMAPVLYLGLRPRAVRLRHQREARRPLRVTFVASALAASLSIATPLVASTDKTGDAPVAAVAVATPAPAPVVAAAAPAGRTCAGPARPRNLLSEVLGKEPAVVDAKLILAFDQLFHDKDKAIYHEVGADEAYILDLGNGDVRSEGMSYGMMIAVQLDRRQEFDRLWRWAKRHMQYTSGPAAGYFAWRKSTSGELIPGDGLPISAPDGEEYFATALILASERWGDGAGILEYSREARELLDFMANGPDTPEARQLALTPLFDRAEKQVVFYPAGAEARFTNPSYHLPAFYEVWACFDAKNEALWRDAAATSREYLRKVTNPGTGLAPEYAGFDATPSTWKGKGDFRYDAWRVTANIMMDLQFYRADPWQAGYAARLAAFFAARPGYVGELTLEGKPLAGAHSPGLVAVNAMLGIGIPADKARPFLKELWELDVPADHSRYYNGVLYMLSMLHVSGKFQLAY